ncbi:Hypothetical predicted protein [Paramuricea clavata]|uniref:Uncharacterized protein n=1 Tax=Paramuricea clavata TaxID=317549 RepID=A0A7D9LE65_PARCT|nr:Hypothetical predicted protein [Paramuricea clavata]
MEDINAKMYQTLEGLQAVERSVSDCQKSVDALSVKKGATKDCCIVTPVMVSTVRRAYYMNNTDYIYNVVYNGDMVHKHDCLNDVVKKQLFIVIPHTGYTSWGLLRPRRCICVRGLADPDKTSDYIFEVPEDEYLRAAENPNETVAFCELRNVTKPKKDLKIVDPLSQQA